MKKSCTSFHSSCGAAVPMDLCELCVSQLVNDAASLADTFLLYGKTATSLIRTVSVPILCSSSFTL